MSNHRHLLLCVRESEPVSAEVRFCGTSSDDGCGAFTLVEILLVVAAISVVATVGVVGLSGMRESADLRKLQNDVAVVNNAIDAYLASGGVIPPDATPEQVLAKLKTAADPAGTAALGFTGPFLDRRLQLVRQSDEEGEEQVARADYPNANGYFFVREGGAAGIKKFVTGEETPLVYENRQVALAHSPQGAWISQYTDRQPVPLSVSQSPVTTNAADISSMKGVDLVKFPRPTVTAITRNGAGTMISYGGESIPLLDYPLQVSLSSPLATRSARIEYRVGGNSFGRYISPFTIDPSSTSLFEARVTSLDASRYLSSDTLAFKFKVQPVPLTIEAVQSSGTGVYAAPPSTLTYAQAGGAIVGQIVQQPLPVSFRLVNGSLIPATYLSSGNFNIRYTTDGTTAATSTNLGPAFTGSFISPSIDIGVAAWGTSNKRTIRAIALSAKPDWFVSSDEITHTITINPTAISVNVLPVAPIGLPPSVSVEGVGSVPTGMRTYYTTNGSAPLTATVAGIPTAQAALYAGAISRTNLPGSTYTFTAQATGPSGREQWFSSQPVARTYVAITAVPLKFIGLNMFRANINGYVKGSIYMQAGDFAVLNAGATVEGNVYVPGLPSVFLPASGGLVVKKGETYNQANDALIATNRITGREYDTNGLLAVPQQDLRKIVDLYGAATPDNYEMRVAETARIDGKLYRRADPPSVNPVAPTLPPEIGLSNAAVTVSGTNVLASGSYALTLNNTNSVLRLGSAGTNVTKYVFGAGSTWTAGRVEILGPVEIYFNAAFSISGVTFGSSNTTSQTSINVMSNYSVSMGTGAVVYGQFDARGSTISVGNDASFYGSAFANIMDVSGRGYVDVSSGTK